LFVSASLGVEGVLEVSVELTEGGAGFVVWGTGFVVVEVSVVFGTDVEVSVTASIEVLGTSEELDGVGRVLLKASSTAVDATLRS
jgi:hypothetical protein